jgi:hypothetical protein
VGLEAFEPRATSKLTKEEVGALKEHVLIPLNQAILETGWSIADSHLDRFNKHGICSFKRTIDELGVPKSRFNPYAMTQRWVRTVNDSFFIQNQMKVPDERDGSLFEPVAEKYLKVYGMVHPNAMGSAAYADAYLEKLNEIIPVGSE